MMHMDMHMCQSLPVAEMETGRRRELSGNNEERLFCNESRKDRARDCCAAWTPKVDTAQRIRARYGNTQTEKDGKT